MNHEEHLARQICRVLDQGIRELDPAIVERLRAARERAVQQQTIPATAFQIVGAGGTARIGHDGDGESHLLRTLFAILALFLGVGLAYYWNGFDQASENEEVDSALLADELSPNAYLDQGFQAWLSHYAQSAR